MIAGELVELALELLAAAFDSGGSEPQLAPTEPVAPLTAREKELSVAIQARRNVTPEVADDLVLWLRSQKPTFHL